VAEYEGLRAAAQWLVDEGIKEKILIKGDSQLVIKQMKGEYRVNSATSKKYVPEIKRLLEGMDVSLSWCPERRMKRPTSSRGWLMRATATEDRIASIRYSQNMISWSDHFDSLFFNSSWILFKNSLSFRSVIIIKRSGSASI